MEQREPDLQPQEENYTNKENECFQTLGSGQQKAMTFEKKKIHCKPSLGFLLKALYGLQCR
jgi:hypothetical protein